MLVIKSQPLRAASALRTIYEMRLTPTLTQNSNEAQTRRHCVCVCARQSRDFPVRTPHFVSMGEILVALLAPASPHHPAGFIPLAHAKSPSEEGLCCVLLTLSCSCKPQRSPALSHHGSSPSLSCPRASVRLTFVSWRIAVCRCVLCAECTAHPTRRGVERCVCAPLDSYAADDGLPVRRRAPRSIPHPPPPLLEQFYKESDGKYAANIRLFDPSVLGGGFAKVRGCLPTCQGAPARLPHRARQCAPAPRVYCMACLHPALGPSPSPLPPSLPALADGQPGGGLALPHAWLRLLHAGLWL